jgi:hypothetical protein
MKSGTCQWCGQPIEWLQTTEGRNVAIDPEPDLFGTVQVVGIMKSVAVVLGRRERTKVGPPLYTLHRLTCANWRGQGKGKEQ